MKQTTDKRELLVGKWEVPDGVSDVIFHISKTRQGLRISAVDFVDGEKLIISNTKWDGNALKFDAYMPSTKWRTKNIFRPVSKTKIVQELTLWRQLKRIPTLPK